MKNFDRLFNRHLAKLLDNLKPLNIPKIQEYEIKRAWRFLQDDIKKQVLQVKTGEYNKNGKTNE